MLKGYLKVSFVLLVIASVYWLTGAVDHPPISQSSLSQNVCSVLPDLAAHHSPVEIGTRLEAYNHELLSQSACMNVSYQHRQINQPCDGASRTLQSCAAGDFDVTVVALSLNQNSFPFVLSIVLLGITAIGFWILNSAIDRLFRLSLSEIKKRISGSFRQKPNPKNVVDRFWFWALRQIGVNDVVQTAADHASEETESVLEEFELLSDVKVAAKVRATEQKEHFEKIRQLRHDLRSPLYSLQTVLGFMDKSNHNVYKLQAAVIKRLHIMLDELDQLGKKPEKRTLVVAEVTLESAVAVQRNAFRDLKKAKLILSYNPDDLSGVGVAEHEFRDVVDSLLSNALASIPQGGHAEISVSRSKNCCIIKVSDNGPGVDREIEDKLFGRGVTTGTQGQPGLSLYHARERIKSWGGSISYSRAEASSESSSGAVFTIVLPLLESGIFVGLTGSERFRIIDDQDATENALIESGFTVLESVSSFDEGAQLLKHAPDDGAIFLVDHRLGDFHLGTDLIASQVKRDKIFLCTHDYDSADVIERAREIGVKILPKPLCLLPPSV